MLDRLHIVDFKGIHDLVVSPGGLTVFIGPNGVGKTSILEAVFVASLLVGDYLEGTRANNTMYAALNRIEGLTDAEARRAAARLTGRWDPSQLVRSGAPVCRLELSVAASVATIELRADKSLPQVVVRHPEAGQSGVRVQDNAELQALARATRLRLDSERVAAPSASRTPTLEYDGAGVPTFLQYLHGRRDGSFEKIEAAMRTIVPTFRQVKFEPATWTTHETEFLNIDGQRVPRVVPREHNGVSLWVEFSDGASVPATHVSEGTLLALTLVAIVHGHQAQQRKLLLIDDIERGLHPAAQHRLVMALKTVLAATPDLQILATTHSPDLIDACDPADVRVLGRGPDGVVARSLTEHPEASKWLKLLRVGEFWSTVGEDWVATEPEPRS